MGHIEILFCIGSNVLVVTVEWISVWVCCLQCHVSAKRVIGQAPAPWFYAVTYCSVLGRPTSHNTTLHRSGPHSSLLAKGPRWRLSAANGTDALSLFQLPDEACP